MVKHTPAELIGLLAPAEEHARKRYLDFLTYLNFIIANGLIKITSDGNYKVTPLGNRFLREFK